VRVGFDLLSLKSVGSFLFGPITEMLWPGPHPIASHRIACNYNVYTNYVLSAPSCFTRLDWQQMPVHNKNKKFTPNPDSSPHRREFLSLCVLCFI